MEGQVTLLFHFCTKSNILILTNCVITNKCTIIIYKKKKKNHHHHTVFIRYVHLLQESAPLRWTKEYSTHCQPAKRHFRHLAWGKIQLRFEQPAEHKLFTVHDEYSIWGVKQTLVCGGGSLFLQLKGWSKRLNCKNC